MFFPLGLPYRDMERSQHLHSSLCYKISNSDRATILQKPDTLVLSWRPSLLDNTNLTEIERGLFVGVVFNHQLVKANL